MHHTKEKIAFYFSIWDCGGIKMSAAVELLLFNFKPIETTAALIWFKISQNVNKLLSWLDVLLGLLEPHCAQQSASHAAQPGRQVSVFLLANMNFCASFFYKLFKFSRASTYINIAISRIPLKHNLKVIKHCLILPN